MVYLHLALRQDSLLRVQDLPVARRGFVRSVEKFTIFETTNFAFCNGKSTSSFVRYPYLSIQGNTRQLWTEVNKIRNLPTAFAS